MLEKAEVIERMHTGGRLEITVQNDSATLRGVAMVDTVIGNRGKEKLRAKFEGGIKAVLDLREYGETWIAEMPEENETGAAGQQMPTGAAGQRQQAAADARTLDAIHGETFQPTADGHAHNGKSAPF